MNDPYKILGVKHDATEDEIKKAYRALAKKLHPDLNPGDSAVEQRFKEVTAAYDLLSDKTKRAQYDRGEVDGGGARKPGAGFWKAWNARAGKQKANKSKGFGFSDLFEEEGADIFDDILRSQSRGTGPGRASGADYTVGRDVTYKLKIGFVDGCAGTTKRVTLSDGKTLDLKIPPGTETGTSLRLKGQGRKGSNDGPAGDAFVEITVEPHDYFVRDGQDIRVEIPVTLYEAVLGGTITVPTVQGNVSLKIPPRSNTGTVLRLKGKGVPAQGGSQAGDQYVTLKIVLPEGDDPELVKLMQKWSEERGYNPRHKMRYT